MTICKLKRISARKIRVESLVLVRVLASTIARFDVFCLFQKSIVQEKNLQFKICIFQCKKIFLGARQATYNQLPLEELNTMSFIQSILNLFGRRETKRRGKYSYESIREIKAKQDKILNEINKQTGKADFRAYRNRMTWIGNKEGKL